MSSSKVPRIKPPVLRQGDTVGIVAPASNVKRDELEAGCDALQRAGYHPIHFDSILDQDLYFAGSIDRRARELEDMFAREDVRAIICARGGYGSNYLLDQLDFKKIKAHPKIFVGYSDLTSLLTSLAQKTGLVTFHGPMVAKDWAHDGGVDMTSWQAALSGTIPWQLPPSVVSSAKGLVQGHAEGILYGGCLSILVASLGTRYEIDTRGTILFVEDVTTKPYQIDRMLMQLKLAGKLSELRGIIFGEMRDCLQTANQGYTLEQVALRIVGGLGIPVAYGLASGHVTAGNITLPFGVASELTVSDAQVSLRILEAAVTARSLQD